MTFLRKIYAAYFAIVFIGMFLVTFPFMALFIQWRATWKIAHFICQYIWGGATLILCGIPFWRLQGYNIQRKEPVIYCSNHASYLDIIASFVLIPGFFTIVGKAELSKIPLFGYFFSRLYIPVDRNSRRSAILTLRACGDALDEGRSVVIYPEGTIPDDGAPKMIKFKSGPFKLAIDKQVPIVPFTFPFNWKILHDGGQKGMKWHWLTAIFHEPIPTKGMTQDNADKLKEQTFNAIQSAIDKYNKHDNRRQVSTGNSLSREATI